MNHLKSFNGRIKQWFFGPYQHSGRLPHIDVWIFTLIVKVIPTFFQELHARTAKEDYLLQMRKVAPRAGNPCSSNSSLFTEYSHLGPKQSLIPSPHEIAAIKSVDEWAGEDWIADLCQSEDEIKRTDDDWDEPVENEDLDIVNVPYLSELVMLPDGHCLPALELPAVVVSDSESDNFNMPDVELEEIAMQSGHTTSHLCFWYLRVRP
ncbi:hypothetical protein JVT61DRAFT_4611 [Boletus reticuloceps]|uniref:Uncharacterized protein n=1 Tax=Boletus reticuloceps TaxID=495285 RepID=A0A8I3A6Z1_9AGAM|nr:hypothetical protein JVT61DRAFT_4611 [Boletus reticuloceps]